MKVKAGQQLASTVDTTRVVVVRAPDADVEIECGGAAMAPLDAGEPTISGEPAADRSDGTLLGKRYADDDLGIELLCTKAGPGSLSVNGQALPVKAPKPLPASD